MEKNLTLLSLSQPNFRLSKASINNMQTNFLFSLRDVRKTDGGIWVVQNNWILQAIYEIGSNKIVQRLSEF